MPARSASRLAARAAFLNRGFIARQLSGCSRYLTSKKTMFCFFFGVSLFLALSVPRAWTRYRPLGSRTGNVNVHLSVPVALNSTGRRQFCGFVSPVRFGFLMNRQLTPVRPATRASDTSTRTTPLGQSRWSGDRPLRASLGPRLSFLTPAFFSVVIGGFLSLQGFGAGPCCCGC